ncbi:MAG: hypothetical protein JXA60_08310 [Candidatus Coatesbacteria bacterium]|nr:hypothetical protein [Candidatus Coatesbacteria bacterium]
MGFTDKLRDIVNKITDFIPGYKGYKDKEELRDTDKQLRDFIGVQFSIVKTSFDKWTKDAANAGDLGILKNLGNTAKILEKITDGIRYAPRGYAGLFDKNAVEEEELEKLHQYDLSILEQVMQLKALFDQDFSKENLANADKIMSEIDKKLALRSSILKPL